MDVDWHAIPGPAPYQPRQVVRAIEALSAAQSDEPVERAAATVWAALCNDHAGLLYPATVPGTSVLLGVIEHRPGPPRVSMLWGLLDWWDSFEPHADFPTYQPPGGVSVEVGAGIRDRVWQAADMLRDVAADPSRGGHGRELARRLVRAAERGWKCGTE